MYFVMIAYHLYTTDKITAHFAYFDTYDAFARKSSKGNPPYRGDNTNTSMHEEAQGTSRTRPPMQADDIIAVRDSSNETRAAVQAALSRLNDGDVSDEEAETVHDNPDQTADTQVAVVAQAGAKRSNTASPSGGVSKKPKGGASLSDSLVRIGEMKMEMQRQKLELDREKMKQRAEIETAKMRLLQEQVAARMQESQERSLMLQLQLETLKQQNRRSEQ